MEAKSPGITVLHRNQFMGLRGIENGVTRFENVRVPAENIVAGEGQGLKVALSTLNTGRLSLPAMCGSSAKLSLKIVREWSNERVQWGVPIGKHEAVAHKIAFIAGLTFAMEAVVELSSLLADEERNDIRIEAALAKLYCSEMAWLVADEMVQIRGGRGFETAESLFARGEAPIPAEQILRDLRISRIFEGSSEIMKLLIAREAVDQHLSVAGDLIDPDVKRAGKGKERGQGRRASTASGCRSWWPAPARILAATRSSARPLPRTCASSSARAASSPGRPSTACRAGRVRLERKQGFLGRIVDIGAELYAMSATCVRTKMLIDARSSRSRGGRRARGAVLQRREAAGGRVLPRPLAERRPRELRGRTEGARGPLRLGRRGSHRPCVVGAAARRLGGHRRPGGLRLQLRAVASTQSCPR